MAGGYEPGLVRSLVNGVAWPGMPSPHGALLLSLLFQLERTQWWPAERLLEHQLLQLAPLLRHAYDMSETIFAEILDAAGQPCRPGETGRLVVTGLHNFAMPLIRYEIGDYAEVGGSCPCGRGLPLLTRIAGRERNMLTLPDGRQLWPSLSAPAWAHVKPVRQLQLVQESAERIVARIVADRQLTAGEEDDLIAALRKGLDYPFKLEVDRVEEISRGAGGKFEQFLSKVR